MLIRIQLKNLKNFVTGTPLAFLVIVLLEIIGSAGVILTYGIVRNTFSEQTESNMFSKFYEYTRWENGVGYSSWDNSDEVKNRFDELMQTELNDKIAQASWYGDVEIDGQARPACFTYYASEEYYDREDMTYQEYFTTGKSVILSQEFSDFKSGDTVIINGESYNVLFVDRSGNMAVSVWMPYDAMPENVSLNSIQFFVKEIPKRSEIESTSEKLYDIFGRDYELFVPDIPDLLLKQFDRTMLLTCGAAMLLIVFNCANVYLYIISRRKNQIIVLKLCGCKNIILFVMLITETVLISASAFGIGTLLTSKLLLPFLSEEYPAFETVYTEQSFGFLFLGYIILSVIVLSVKLIAFLSSTVNEMRGDRI